MNTVLFVVYISERGKHSSPCKYSVTPPLNTHIHVHIYFFRFVALTHIVAMAINPPKLLFNGFIPGDTYTNTYTKLSDKCTLYFVGSLLWNVPALWSVFFCFLAANFDWNWKCLGGKLLCSYCNFKKTSGKLGSSVFMLQILHKIIHSFSV